MPKRIGILGGTFDPIHCGHLDVGMAAEAALGLTRMFVIPSNVPPHRPQPVASAFHRFAMVALSVAGRSLWRASDEELREDALSYTSTTLQRFHARGHSPAELFFIVGADAFAEIGTWRDYPAILDHAHFAVVSRPGCPASELPSRLPRLADRMVRAGFDPTSDARTVIILIDAPTANVSSTAIRHLLAEGRSIAGMVEASVQQHIEQHGLYASDATGAHGSDQPSTPAAGRLHG